MELEDIYKKYKTKISVGDNIVIYQMKHFNWFRKLMYKLAFDIKIEDLDKNHNKIYNIFKKQEKGYHTKAILQLKNGKIIKKYKSVNEAQRKTKFSRSHIIECCKGRRKTAYGYQWKYEE